MRKLLGILLLAIAITAGFVGLRRVSAAGATLSFTGTSYTTGQSSPGVLLVEDFNSDGATDVAVTTNGGVVTLLGQFSAGKASGALGNTQVSTIHANCGTAVNLALGRNQGRYAETPTLYGVGSGSVSQLSSTFHITSSSAIPTTTASCNNANPSGGLNWMALADFNGDGYPDGVAVNNSNTINLATGSSFAPHLANFASSVTLPGGLTNSTTVAAGDYDGDGRPDIVAAAGTSVAYFPASANSNVASVFSTGTATSVSIGGSSSINRLLIADATGNGKPDIIATTATSVVVISPDTNSPLATQTSVSIPVNYTANSTAVADVDGDGHPDLVVAATGTGGAANNVLLVYPGNGTTFGSVQTIQIGSNASASLSPADVVAADMDRDGRMDLVVSTATDGNVWVLLNRGNRLIISSSTTLQFHGVIGQASPTAATITVGTSDSQSTPSLSVAASPLAPALSWVALSASGNQVTIAPNMSTVSKTGTYHGLAAVTGAGYMQLLIPYTVTVTQQTGTVIRGGQSGNDATGLPAPNGSGGPLASRMAFADFNGDGIPDIVSELNASVCTSVRGGVYRRKAEGTGYDYPSCSQTVSLFNNAPSATLAADFNLDGKQDAVFVTANGIAVVGFGDGTGGLGGNAWYPIQFGGNSGAVADFNGDGAPDAVIAAGPGTAGGGINILLNKGDGTFSVGTLQSGQKYLSVVVADFNGDGIPDIAARNQTSNSEWGLEVFIGLGGGQFSAPQKVSFFDSTCSGTTAQCTRPTYQNIFNNPSLALVAGDFNGDGLADLAFIDKPESGQPLDPAIVVALASADAGHNVTFNLSTQGPILQNSFALPYFLDVGDLDGDGRLDLVFNKTGSSGVVAIQFGNGNGTFGHEADISYSFIGNNSGTRLVDLDGDGRLDIVGPVVAGDFGGTATGIFMGSRVATSLAFNGAPVSAASLTSENITFRGTITLSHQNAPYAPNPFHWVRNTTVPITFYDNYPSTAGTGVPTVTANTLVGTYSGAVTIGTHAFEARFPGDNRMLPPSNSPVYAPGMSFTTQPSNAVAGTAMSPNPVVKVTQPGGATDTSFNGPVSIGLDHGSFSGGVVTTVNAVNGIATFTGVKIAQGGTFYLTAMAGSTLINSNNFNVSGGPMAGLAITGLATSVTAGTPTSFTVQAQDSNGFAAGNYTGTVHFTSSDGSAVVPSNYTFVTGDFSSHTFNVTFKTAGQQAIAVTDIGTPTYTASAGTTVGAGAAASVTLNSPSSTGINTAFETLTATVKDQYNNLVSGATVTFATTAGGTGSNGTFTSGATAVTDSTGVASKTLTANNVVGTFTVTGSAGSATSQPRTLTITGGTAASLAYVAGNSQTTAVGTAFATQFQVKALDAGENPVAGFNVTFTSPSSGASCGYPSSNTTVVATNSSGIASVTCTANGTPGSYSVTASGSSVSPVTISSLSNAVGSAANLTVTKGNPQSATVNTAFTDDFHVKLTDGSNNPIAGEQITFTAPGTGPSGTFSGSVITATAITDGSGIAIAPPFTAGTKAGTYQLTASYLSLHTGISLTNTAGPADQMTISAGNNQTVSVNSTLPTALAVKVTDQYLNPVSGVTVTFTAPGSGASGQFPGSSATATANTNASGIATAPAFTTNGTIGAYNVTADAGALSATFNLTNILIPATGIAVHSGSGQSTQMGTQFAAPLVARVYDSSGNGVPNAVVTFTLPPTGASAAFNTSTPLTHTATTDAQGLAVSASMIANTTLGTYNVTATTASYSTSFTLSNGPPPPLTVAPSVLSFRYEIGGTVPPSQTATVTGSQGGFSVATDVAWLKATSRQTNSDNLVVSADPKGLNPGNYTGIVTVGNGAALRVSLLVVSAPQIVPSARSLTFRYKIGDPAPVSQMLYVTAYTRNFDFTATPVQTGSASPAWLKVGASGGTTPTGLPVSVAPAGLAAGMYQGAVRIVAADATNSPLDVNVTLVVEAVVVPVTPEMSAVVNAASSQNGPAAANEIATIYGKNLACASGPEVLVNGTPASILAATDTQINFVFPALAGAGQVMVEYRCGSATAGPMALQVAPHNPGLFVSGGSQVAAYNEGFVLNGSGNPAARGSVVMLFGTGFGELAAADGAGLHWLPAKPSVTIGGVAADVVFAGAAPGLPGVTQINVRIPAGAPSGAAPVAVSIGGVSAQSGLTLAIQ